MNDVTTRAWSAAESATPLELRTALYDIAAHVEDILRRFDDRLEEPTEVLALLAEDAPVRKAVNRARELLCGQPSAVLLRAALYTLTLCAEAWQAQYDPDKTDEVTAQAIANANALLRAEPKATRNREAPGGPEFRAALSELAARAEAVLGELAYVHETRNVEDSLRNAPQHMEELSKSLRFANELLCGERHEIMTVLVLSSSHVRPETMELIESEAADTATAVSRYGVFKHVPSAECMEEGLEDNEPEELRAIYAYCRVHGFEWFRLDEDGPRIGALPAYDVWNGYDWEAYDARLPSHQQRK